MEGKQGIGYCSVKLAALHSAESFSPGFHLHPDQAEKNVFRIYFHSRYNTRATGGVTVYDDLEERDVKLRLM